MRVHANGAIAAIAFFLASAGGAAAETRAETCHRLASDAVKLDAIDGEQAVPACADAAAASPQNQQLEYEYARALENAAKTDQAKQIYQWIASDGYAPAVAALARLAGPLTGDAAERERVAQRLDAVAAIAERIAKETPRDHEDPNTVLVKTGKDPAKILAWVKANTRLVPYAGMLRDAPGVLIDRAGNSLDRALFLADLLHRAGYQARIARAQISPQAAEVLRQRFVGSAVAPGSRPTFDKALLTKLLGSDPRLDPESVQQAINLQIVGMQKFKASIADLYGKVAPAVLHAIDNDPRREAKLSADADAILRDHFWVQINSAGAWNDLDPDGAENIAPVSTFLPSETPPNLKQRVALILTIEILTGQKIVEKPILQQSWLASDMAGVPITLTHALYPDMSPVNVLKSVDKLNGFRDAVQNATVIMPILQVGSRAVKGELYGFDGQVEDATPENLASMGGTAILSGGKLANSIASVFGDASTSNSAPSASQSIVTAEWLEMDVSVPGKAIHKSRRKIFDLIGGIARQNPETMAPLAITDEIKLSRNLSLTGSTGIVIETANRDADVSTRKISEAWAAIAHREAHVIRTAASFDDVLSENPLSVPNESIEDWMVARQWAPRLSYPVEPNIVALWQTPRGDASHGLSMRAAFDIFDSETSADLLFSTRVSQGVWDTVVEHGIVPGFENAAIQTAEGLRQGRLPTRSNQSSIDLASPGASGQIDLSRQLREGKIVLLPGGQPSASPNWWEIDPTTGNTFGVDEADEGASAAEYAVLTQSVRIRSYFCVGSVILSAAYAAHKEIQNGTGSYGTIGIGGAAALGLCAAGSVMGNAAIANGFAQGAENGTAYAVASGQVGNAGLISGGTSTLSPIFSYLSGQ